MVDRDQAEEMLKEINQQFQFPRLLSSRKLLELEVSINLEVSCDSIAPC